MRLALVMVLEMSRHHAQLNRVSVRKPPREQSDDADMADPDNDRRGPREPVWEERDKESKDHRLRWRRKR